MRAIVVGAGAWGLPTATRIAEQGHTVTLIDRWGPGNPLSSSPGPSRIWRLADHRPDRVELSRLAIEALERSEEATGEELFTRSGMLWRHEPSNEAVVQGLQAVNAPVERVLASQVGDYFPGLRPTNVDAVWTPIAGTLLADRVIRSETQRFERAGGTFLVGQEVQEIRPGEPTASVLLDDGRELDADVVIVAAGMGAKALIDPLLPRPLPFVTRLEQVVHFGTPQALPVIEHLPTIFDGATDGSASLPGEPGMYGMATPGIGYKVGLDVPIREFDITDPDRTPSEERTELLRQRIARDFEFPAVVIDAVCCNWTDSPDGDFVLDRLPGNVVVGAGDSGEGFKFTSLIGEILAGLATGATPPVSLEQFRIDRFESSDAFPPSAMGSTSLRRFGE